MQCKTARVSRRWPRVSTAYLMGARDVAAKSFRCGHRCWFLRLPRHAPTRRTVHHPCSQRLSFLFGLFPCVSTALRLTPSQLTADDMERLLTVLTPDCIAEVQVRALPFRAHHALVAGRGAGSTLWTHLNFHA